MPAPGARPVRWRAASPPTAPPRAGLPADTYTRRPRLGPAIAFDRVGDFVVVLEEPRPRTAFPWRVYGSCSADPFAPAALRDWTPRATASSSPARRQRVDAAEPGVNLNGAPQMFIAAARRIPLAPPAACPASPSGRPIYGIVSGRRDRGMLVVLHALRFPRPHRGRWCTGTRRLDERIAADGPRAEQRWTLHVGESFTDVPRASALLSVRRDAAAPRRDRRLHRDASLPGRAHDARADAGLRPGREGRRFATSPPAVRRDAAVRRRARHQPLLPLDRGAGAARRGRRTAEAAAIARPPPSPASRWRSSSLRTLDPALHPTRVHDAGVRRRPCVESVLPLDRGARSPGGRQRVRRRELLPATPVTREQMGVFIGMTFGLTLYGP